MVVVVVVVAVVVVTILLFAEIVDVTSVVDGLVAVWAMLEGLFSTGQILRLQGSVEQQPEKPPSLH